MTDKLSQVSHASSTPAQQDELPQVVLEFRQGAGRTSTFTLSHVDFLIGTVPGCDLRVPGSDLPAVLCLLARRPGGLSLRKLAPAQMILVNGQTASQSELNDGDRITLGAADLFVRITAAAKSSPPAPPLASTSAGANPLDRDFQKKYANFQDQVARFQTEREVFETEHKQRLAELEESERRSLQRERELQQRAAELEQERGTFQQRRQQIQDDLAAPGILPPDLPQREEQISLREAELQDQLAELQRQRQDLANVRQELAEIRKQLYDRYQERRDRLGNLQESVDRAARKVQERKRQVDAEEQELTERAEQLNQQSASLDDDRHTLEEDRRKLEDKQRDQAQKQIDLQTREHRLAADRLELEGKVKHYQADMLRLDRMQEDLEARDRRLLALDRDLEERRKQLERASTELEQHTLETEQWRTRLAAEEEQLARTRGEQEALAVDLAERAASQESLEASLSALKSRLERQRDELSTLEQHLEEQRTRQAQAEVEVERQNQENLRVRHELDGERKRQEQERQEIIRRQTALDTGEVQLRQAQEHQAREEADLKQRTEELERRLAEKGMVLEEQSRQLDQQRAELADLMENERQQLADLRAVEQSIVAERGQLAGEREQFQLERQQGQQAHEAMRTEFIEMRLQAQSFVEQLPDIELQAGGALDKLTQAREQLRDHLAEINTYVRQCQEEMEKDGRKLHEKEKAIRQAQDDHRLALVSFRQQLIDWQSQAATGAKNIGSIRPESPRAEPRKLETPATPPPSSRSATAAPAPSPAPARQSTDVNAWFRKKLRDVSGLDVTQRAAPTLGQSSAAGPTAGSTDEEAEGDAPIIPIRRDILAMTDPADPSDRQLGDQLRKLDLVDADSLQALLVESRRQRRPLRQTLLAGGALTAYQLTLIESGNVDGLLLGSLRIIDRLRVSAQETVYHVFDPRRGYDAMLRHLAEEQARIPNRAEEFRRGFAQAILNEPHLAQTLEVLEISGRPAALQERLTGLASPDWPALVSVSGVCFRLLIQAAQALESIHSAGFVHGHLNENLILLTTDGVVKICGLGEPAWLSDEPRDANPSVENDLQTLGKIVSNWCTPAGMRRGAKTKPPPDALLTIVLRLAEESPGYARASKLLEDLEQIRKEVPTNSEAWERLLRHLREHAGPIIPMRLSA